MEILPEDKKTISVVNAGAQQSSNTYKMRIEDDEINGCIDGNIEAVKQAVYKILNTERYKHIIYSWNYGVELNELLGKPLPYVMPEIPRRIEEALLMDDRITKVDNFELSADKRGNVTTYFVVHSIYGAFDMQKVVNTKNV